jgi:hypothetical protein
MKSSLFKLGKKNRPADDQKVLFGHPLAQIEDSWGWGCPKRKGQPLSRLKKM